MISRRTARHPIMLIGVLVLIQATILTAAARSLPRLPLAETFAHPELSWQLDVPSAKKSCPKMEVSDPALWFDVDENGDPDLETIVDSYPSGVVAIVAGFEYNCVPAQTTVAAIFYSLEQGGDKPWHTSEVKLAPTDKSGVLWRGVRFKDRRPIPDGDYRVEFFLGKKLLTAGEVTVGGQEEEQEQGREPKRKQEEEEEQEQEQEQGRRQEQEEEPKQEREQEREERRQRENLVQIEGKIIDGATQQPIRGLSLLC
ncbi:MAG: hypothetical protein ACP5R2_08740 [Anaerolineae bacterium]